MAKSDTIYILPPEYQFSKSMMPRGYEAAKELLPASFWREHTLWEVSLIENATGKILQNVILPNVVTDTGGNAMLSNTWNVAGNTPKIFNQIAVAQGAVSTTLTTGLTGGTTYSSGVVSVSAIQVALNVGQQVQLVQIGVPTPATLTLYVTSAAAANATSLTLGSTAGTAGFSTPANTAFAAGSYVLQVPQATDNPSALTGAIYSGALSSGAFTGPTGSGTGQRTLVVQYQFNGGSFASGGYMEIFTTNGTVSATGQCGTHLITVVNNLTSSNSILAKDTIQC